MQEGPRQPQDKFVLRLPDGMRDEIAKAAKANGRSMNAEIVNRLKDSLDDDERAENLKKFIRLGESSDKPPGKTIEQKISALLERIEKDSEKAALLARTILIKNDQK